MKKLLFVVPLMAAGFAVTGCGLQGRSNLTIAIDSDTIVIPKPEAEPELIPVVADSDSLAIVLREDSILREARRHGQHMPPPPPGGQRPPLPRDGHNPPPPPDGHHEGPPQGPPPHEGDGHNPPPPPEGQPVGPPQQAE